MKNRFVVSALVGVAFIISGCADPAPTELPADGTLSATAAPKKSVPVTAVMDISGPIPGLPNIINPDECITVDTETLTAHFKNCIVVGTTTGDLTGDVTGTLNGTQSLVDLSAVAHGHMTLDVCHVDLGCGSFLGPHKAGAPAGGQATLRGNLRGTGDFHTLQSRLTAVERGNTSIYDVDGVIF